MIGPGFGEQLAKSLALGFVLAVLLAFALGVLITLALPNVWAWLIPIIHAATA